MKRVFSVTVVLLLILPNALRAADENRLGLSPARILRMTPEKWGDYYSTRKPGGEAGLDVAYETYALCMRERTDRTLAQLPHAVSERIRRYRQLCGKFRTDMLELQQAYAGGGTIYGHAETRGLVDDERLVARIAQAYTSMAARRPTNRSSASLDRVRRHLSASDPTTAANRKRLAEFTMGDQAIEAHRDGVKDFRTIAELLAAERPDVRRMVVKFLEEWSRPYVG